MQGQLTIFDYIRPAVWKYDSHLGIAYFCPDCKRFVCLSGKCKCGNYVDLDLPKKQHKGMVKWS